MFSVHTAQEELKNATVIGYFGCVLKENRMIIVKPSVSKSPGVFKFLLFEERF